VREEGEEKREDQVEKKEVTTTNMVLVEDMVSERQVLEKMTIFAPGYVSTCSDNNSFS